MQKITFFLCKERSKETPTNDFFKIRRRRRTCADDGDTYREIYPKIVCEEPATSARFWGKFCRRGIQMGETGVTGTAVHDCCPR